MNSPSNLNYDYDVVDWALNTQVSDANRWCWVLLARTRISIDGVSFMFEAVGVSYWVNKVGCRADLFSDTYAKSWNPVYRVIHLISHIIGPGFIDVIW